MTIVIDADIARSSGDGNNRSQVSTDCHLYLKSVEDCRHSAAFDSRLAEEWDKHQSGYARKWRYGMLSRDKIAFSDEKTYHISKALESQAIDEFIRNIITKDIHLAEIAIQFDFVIATKDKKFIRAIFQNCLDIPVISQLYWHSPECHTQVNSPNLKNDRRLTNVECHL